MQNHTITISLGTEWQQSVRERKTSINRMSKLKSFEAESPQAICGYSKASFVKKLPTAASRSTLFAVTLFRKNMSHLLTLKGS